MELVVNKVCKQIQKRKILSDISLSLSGGHIYGFVGRNGSGKTMLFRALSGLMKIDSGEITYNGQILHKDIPVLPNLGIILENAGLYPDLTGFKNLQMLAQINNKIDDQAIVTAIKRVGLDPKDKRPYRKYSLGMKQRIVIAQAVMEMPDILMLDEPTNSLDANGVEDIRQMIIEEKQRGAIILLASHNKEDIQYLADVVYHLDAGCLIKEESTL